MKKLWELVVLIFVAAFVVNYAVTTITPLIPIIAGIVAVVLIGVLIYRRRRRW